MDTAAGHNKQRSVEAQLVICSEATRSIDLTVKVLIDELLVPLLVEEYIRLHHSNRDEDANPLTAEPASTASSSIARAEKSHPNSDVEIKKSELNSSSR
jgi:hypothetical protein